MFQRFVNVIAMLSVGASVASAAIVKGVVTDSNGEPMPDATVRILKASADSAFVSGGTTDLNGVFAINDVKKGSYIVQAKYLGYTDATCKIQVGRASEVKVDTLRLRESSIMLREAVAIGVATPIKAMEDTIEYSAASYRTPPNAVVNDLLKRLPGVEIGSDGAITAQGQTVKKILIDGQEFFSDDPKVAAKNIPVDMVKSAQVINRKSDLARMTGVDDGDDEMVINLTIKEDKKQGWYGSVAAGFGPALPSTGPADWNEYKGSFIVNGMFGKNMVTILGNANNVNDEGFTDNNAQRFRRFGGVEGVNTTQSLGVNLNLGTDKLRYGGSIFYSHNDRENHTLTHRRNIFNDGEDTQEDNDKSSRDKGHNFTANLRLKWDPDSFNTLDFRPNFNFNKNNSQSSAFGVNYLHITSDPTTNSRNLANSDGTNYDINGRLIYNHNFESHRGRSFSISANYSFSSTTEDEETWSRNVYWNPSVNSIYEDYQEIHNHNWNNGINTRLSWTEPIGNVKNGNFLELAYSMNYRWNNADKTVRNAPLDKAFGELTDAQREEIRTWRELNWRQWGDWGMSDRWAGLAPDDLTLDEANSTSFRNHYFNQQIRVGYKKVHKDYTLNAGVSFNPQMSRSEYLSGNKADIPTRWVWNYAPFLRLRYKFSKQTSLNAFYNGRSSQPSMTQLQPVADTSDPMNVIQGNPDLNPSFNHTLALRFSDFNLDRQQSIFAALFANYTQNAVASNVTTDRVTGGRHTTYANVNGNWNIGVFSTFSRPLKNKKWTFSDDIHFNFRQDVGFTNGELSKSGDLRAGLSFAFKFQPASLELELRPRYDIQRTTNDLQPQSNRFIHSYGGTFNGSWYTPFGLVLATDLNYMANSGYSEGFNTNEVNWNASISYMFLANKAATIALVGKDLLNQHQSIRRTSTAQAIIDTDSFVLGRYAMITFTYNFSTFAGGKRPDTGGNDEFIRRGPGGMPPGGPGHGPGGPGPR